MNDDDYVIFFIEDDRVTQINLQSNKFNDESHSEYDSSFEIKYEIYLFYDNIFLLSHEDDPIAQELSIGISKM